MTSEHYEAMKRCDDNYKDLTINELDALVNKGSQLIEKHGEENLQNSLTDEADFFAAGAFFTYRLVTETDDE